MFTLGPALPFLEFPTLFMGGLHRLVSFHDYLCFAVFFVHFRQGLDQEEFQLKVSSVFGLSSHSLNLIGGLLALLFGLPFSREHYLSMSEQWASGLAARSYGPEHSQMISWLAAGSFSVHIFQSPPSEGSPGMSPPPSHAIPFMDVPGSSAEFAKVVQSSFSIILLRADSNVGYLSCARLICRCALNFCQQIDVPRMFISLHPA
ncbi:hypothetical protein C8J56DRAFT_1057946 [Mycena floridula]|nr:hypothetical protein C8J56DRAFT_1057946 [Mycena floridula]